MSDDAPQPAASTRAQQILLVLLFVYFMGSAAWFGSLAHWRGLRLWCPFTLGLLVLYLVASLAMARSRMQVFAPIAIALALGGVVWRFHSFAERMEDGERHPPVMPLLETPRQSQP